jgi:O-methyltransferase involved in polyketide biosynthesis
MLEAREFQTTVPIIVDPKSAEIVRAIDCDFDTFATAKKSHIAFFRILYCLALVRLG